MNCITSKSNGLLLSCPNCYCSLDRQLLTMAINVFSENISTLFGSEVRRVLALGLGGTRICISLYRLFFFPVPQHPTHVNIAQRQSIVYTLSIASLQLVFSNATMDRDTESISGPSRPAVYDPVSVQDTSFDAPPGYSQNGHTYSADPNGYQKGKSSFPRDPTFERNGTSIDGVNHQHEGHRHATLAMKKALWWRNAIVTGTFILTWSALL